MSLSTKDKLAHVALSRFGLGAKPGGILKVRANAKKAVLAELNSRSIAKINDSTLPTYEQACQEVNTDFSRENALREKELTARIAKHISPTIGFVERLVLFFSNHFSMSINKDGAIRATIGQLERDVIRNHVLGNFKDMFLGVMQHPAMLAYLDNDDSIGPQSVSGLAWGAGLNKNLAREILELHTLGVNGGYGEADVTALAKIITGWSYVRGWEAEGRHNGGLPALRGRFIFRADWHEPGAQVLLGKSYAQEGISQGIAALSALALHPSTAQFIAFKLVRHFITDDPTPDLVKPVAAAFVKSKGNLKSTATALVNLSKAWSLPLTKLRTPYELQIAEMRALGRTYPQADRWPFVATLAELRHLPWERPAPDGYSDDTVYWIGPNAMRIRLETAQMNAWGLTHVTPEFTTPALAIADGMYKTALSPLSRAAIAGAPDLQNGLATLFMIPEFQRR
jgi:uncharacterized protein (DUF1800 family)